MAKHYPQMVCHTHRQQRQKKQSHIYRNHLCFWRSEALCPTGHSFHELCWHRVCSMSCADTECVAGLKCSPGTATPTLPSASFVPSPREGGSSLLPRKHLRRDKANVQIPQILAQVSSTSSKSLCSNCAAPCFSCSLLPSQSFSLLLLSSTSCVVWRHWDSRGCCWHLEPSRWLCCASSYQTLLWIQDLMKFSLSLCCLAFQLFFLNFQRVQKLK